MSPKPGFPGLTAEEGEAPSAACEVTEELAQNREKVVEGAASVIWELSLMQEEGSSLRCVVPRLPLQPQPIMISAGCAELSRGTRAVKQNNPEGMSPPSREAESGYPLVQLVGVN